MKKLLIATMISTSIALTCYQSTGQQLDPTQLTMNKKMVSMERGVVLMYDDVKVKGTQVGAAVALIGLAAMAISEANEQPFAGNTPISYGQSSDPQLVRRSVS
ncbi:hypothetical protein [Vibrio owensii]|uniref:Uncharacterized protein n=1 Tax=Vibrio owensii CAIM 1854 = LMG 25443 TaxID=1229493 RepID=A0A0C1YMI1_9VIBR|nr:hypothetical protein [Vibrio owensii]KIF45319.1 hypothetical protein H735_29710 [Vibrio owensii CAIM 1854 = LMG 25443]